MIARPDPLDSPVHVRWATAAPVPEALVAAATDALALAWRLGSPGSSAPITFSLLFEPTDGGAPPVRYEPMSGRVTLAVRTPRPPGETLDRPALLERVVHLVAVEVGRALACRRRPNRALGFPSARSATEERERRETLARRVLAAWARPHTADPEARRARAALATSPPDVRRRPAFLLRLSDRVRAIANRFRMHPAHGPRGPLRPRPRQRPL